METASSLYIKNMQNLPIWIKQVLACELSQDLNRKLNEFMELVNGELLFQYVIPKTSIKGQEEFDTRRLNLSEGYYTFLSDSKDGKNTIFEITVRNNWTLADSAKIFTRLYELEFVNTRGDLHDTSLAVALFVASKIKTGEFLKKIGRIDATQLEQALRYQKQLNEEGRHIKMASILIKMGFITDKGLDSLLLLKDEAKRRLPVNIGYATIQYENEDDKNDQLLRMQKEIARLENENIIMKKRLKKLLNVD